MLKNTINKREREVLLKHRSKTLIQKGVLQKYNNKSKRSIPVMN